MNREDLARIEPLNAALFAAWGPGGSDGLHNEALRAYLRARTDLGQSYRMFEIANHRLFRTKSGLLVPYDAHGLLIVFHLEPENSRIVFERKFPHGTVFTDELIFGMCGCEGEVIDLQTEIYHLDVADMETVKVHRLRDLARVLERINASGSRHEVVYLLRFLVARLCSSGYRDLASAKNLQPEVLRVRNAMVTFLDGPFAHRLALPARVLVRNVSSLLTQPRVIERVWQDTIDLCEVLVRNSSIATEIRRSTHHSLGDRTLELARAYADWLKTGSAEFPGPDHMVPAASDEEARSRPEVLALVESIRDDLGHLLGGAQLTQRLREWRESYAQELTLCESGRSFSEEVDGLLGAGAGDGNRWTWQQHLRVLDRYADGDWHADDRAGISECLDRASRILPGDDAFPAEAMRERITAASDGFLQRIRGRHQDRLFAELDALEDLLANDRHFRVFEFCGDLRHRLSALSDGYVFGTQRLLLFQLDCLLEEIAYFAARHVANHHDDEGLDLEQSLAIVQRCAENLSLDGLYSRELSDLACLLSPASGDGRALFDVLEQIQRNYHLLVGRVSVAYEVMADHLGYGGDEMRGVLGNFFRNMHDLNLIAQFSDAARARLSAGAYTLPGKRAGSRPVDPWHFQHLSHRDEVIRRVEDPSEPCLREQYGGKGSGLLYLTYLGVPTRDGFVIPTAFARQGLHERADDRLGQALPGHIRTLEADILREDGTPVRLGDPKAPLLLAVRGGSVFSMPGQLATIVFVGMTRNVVKALADDDEWFAWDAMRRFLSSYAAARWRLDLEDLHIVDRKKSEFGVAMKTELPGSAMRSVADECLVAIREAGHGDEIDAVLDDAGLQLVNAVRSVFDSWDAERARRYRRIKRLSDHWNTAVIVQQMAAGNHSNPDADALDETRMSLTGVIPRTRMQANGFRTFTGDIKFGASGDDLVGGLTEADSFEPVQHLHERAPMLERRINHVNTRIRRFMGTDAEIEFTVDRGVLSVLQTRSAETVHVFKPRTFLDPGPACGQGVGVMGGAFRGLAAFDEADAKRQRAAFQAGREDVDGVLLVLENPVPDEIPLILSVDGLMAARGGSTAHAAVAVNGIDDRPFSAVLGIPQLKVRDGRAKIVAENGEVVADIASGDIVSIHGQTGEVYVGPREIVS